MDFYKALGQNKTIEYLNIDMDSTSQNSVSTTNLNKFANGLAMNKKKNGSLTTLSAKFLFKGGFGAYNGFCDSLKISDQMEEQWYGEKKVADEMKGD